MRRTYSTADALARLTVEPRKSQRLEIEVDDAIVEIRRCDIEQGRKALICRSHNNGVSPTSQIPLVDDGWYDPDESPLVGIAEAALWLMEGKIVSRVAWSDHYIQCFGIRITKQVIARPDEVGWDWEPTPGDLTAKDYYIV